MANPPVQIIAFGINHRTAPVELRETLVFGPEELPGVLARLRDLQVAEELLLLTTCNRTEVYAVCANPAVAAAAVTRTLAELRGLLPAELEPLVYQHDGPGAVTHLFRVITGLDSLVIGETQILGQVREAYQEAVQAGTVGRILHHLLHQALGVGKRAHTETGIGDNAVSVSYAAVELAKKLFQTLKGRPVMAIGAGEMSKLTVRHLQAAGVGQIIVANRTLGRARHLAEAVGGTPVALDDVPAYLSRVDVVISSTGAPGYVLTRERLQEALRVRRGRPIFLFDIAVPRDIEPGCAALEGVFLYDIDDLQQVVAANLQERAREARKVEKIIEEEAERFTGWLRTRDVAPTIRSLREKVESIRQHELHRAMARLPDLSERDRQVIAAMTVALVKKIMNPPTQRLMGLAEEGDAGAAAEAMALLFELTPAPSAPAKGEAPEKVGPGSAILHQATAGKP